MKKMASVVLLVLLCFVGGCSCGKNIYKFDSIEITTTEETKTYTCSTSEKEDANIKTMCENLQTIKIEIKDEKTLVMDYPATNINNEELKYKIEEGYLYLEDGEDWMRFAEYSDERIVILASAGIRVILKK